MKKKMLKKRKTCSFIKKKKRKEGKNITFLKKEQRLKKIVCWEERNNIRFKKVKKEKKITFSSEKKKNLKKNIYVQLWSKLKDNDDNVDKV